jgi:hypothetical protein
MPYHLDYKMTASKLAADKRLRTSQVLSSKNSHCLSIQSYDELDLTNNFAGQTFSHFIDDIGSATYDKKRSVVQENNKHP